jgi:hypothetical protein
MPSPIGSSTPQPLPAVAYEPPPTESPDLEASAPPLGLSHPLDWYRAKALSETACLLPCDQALGLAKYEMEAGGLGRRMLEHFLSGDARPVHVDLDPLFERNAQLKQLVSAQIEFDLAVRAGAGESVEHMSGAVWVTQPEYGTSDAGKDQRYTFGATFFEYQVVGSSDDGGLTVRIDVSDHYFWSPAEERATQCLHACGSELVSAGKASEFHQTGEGYLTVMDPRVGDPMAPPDLQPEDVR